MSLDRFFWRLSCLGWSAESWKVYWTLFPSSWKCSLIQHLSLCIWIDLSGVQSSAGPVVSSLNVWPSCGGDTGEDERSGKTEDDISPPVSVSLSLPTNCNKIYSYHRNFYWKFVSLGCCCCCAVRPRISDHRRDVRDVERQMEPPLAVAAISRTRPQTTFVHSNLKSAFILVPTSTDCALRPLSWCKTWQIQGQCSEFYSMFCFRMCCQDAARAGPQWGRDQLLHQQRQHPLHPHPQPPRTAPLIQTPKKRRWSLLNLNICSGKSCWQKLKIEKDRNLFTNTKWKTFPPSLFLKAKRDSLSRPQVLLSLLMPRNLIYTQQTN